MSYKSHVLKIKEKKLDELKKQLKSKHEKAISGLRLEHEQKTALLKREETNVADVTKAQKQFWLDQQVDFAREAYKQGLTQRMWDDVTSEYFRDDKNFEKWLKKQVAEIDKIEGAVVANSRSEKFLKRMDKFKGLEIKVEDTISDGLIIEDEDMYLDMTLDTFLKESLEQNFSELYQLLFK